MKKYENIDQELKDKLIDICSKDPYSLAPQTLYRNILNSTGNYETLASIFAVPLDIIKEIKDQQYLELKGWYHYLDDGMTISNETKNGNFIVQLELLQDHRYCLKLLDENYNTISQKFYNEFNLTQFNKQLHRYDIDLSITKEQYFKIVSSETT